MNLAWQHGIGGETAPAVTALVRSATETDGVAPLSGHVLADLASLEHLSAFDGARLAGLAVRHGGDPAELVVDPAHRRRGLGRDLLRAALDSAGAVWALGDLPAARALADDEHLARVRELLQLRRPLNERYDVDLPAGVRLRAFVPGRDEDAFLAVNARAFAWHPEQGRLDAAGLAAEEAQGWFDPAGFFLAVDGQDTVLGFHWTKVHAADPTPAGGPAEAIGEIYVIGVDPASPVRRLGSPLTAVGLNHLAGRGLSTVMLYVEGDNEPALKLYRRFGFAAHLTNAVYARR